MRPDTDERKLAAIVLTDIVGYAALVEIARGRLPGADRGS